MLLNKKGFTLIELLAVIILLALIFSIGSPTVTTIIANVKENSVELTENSIKKSAVLYTKENPDIIDWSLPKSNVEKEEEYTCVTLEELINKGFLKRESIKQYYENKEMEVDLNNTAVKITRDYNNKAITKQEFDDNAGSCSTNIDLNIGINMVTSYDILMSAKCTTETNTVNDVTYSLDKNTWYNGFKEMKNANVTESGYLFNKDNDNIKPNTKYTVYTKCAITEDNTGEEYDKTGTFVIAKKTIVTGNYGKIKIDTPNECSPSKEITITSTGITNGSIQYSFDGNDWKDYDENNKPVMTSNGIIYAKYANSNEYVTKTITSIDNNIPVINVTDIEKSNEKATINYEVTGKGTCGTPKYTCNYGTNENYENFGIATSNSCKLTNLIPGTKYYYKIIATNANGNKDEVTGTFNTKENIYTITLDNNNADTAGTTTIYETYGIKYSLIKDGSAMTNSTNKITIPSKIGYTFGGYYTDSGGTGTQYINSSGYLTSNASNTKFSSNGTLYVKWVANKYTITYKLGNGGTSEAYTTLGKSECIYGSTCTLKTFVGDLRAVFPYSAEDNINYAWSFYGWSNSSDNDNSGIEREYKDGERFTYSVANNLTLYALGYKNFYFYAGKAPVDSMNKNTPVKQYWNPASTGTAHLSSIMTLKQPSDLGGLSSYAWEFLGYKLANSTANSSIDCGAGVSFKPKYDADRYARAVYKRTVSLKYNKNGGSGTMTNSTSIQYYNSGIAYNGSNTGDNITTPKFTLKANSFTNSGYKFYKWADISTTGTQYNTGITYTGFKPAVNSSSLTRDMYAIWLRIVKIKESAGGQDHEQYIFTEEGISTKDPNFNSTSASEVAKIIGVIKEGTIAYVTGKKHTNSVGSTWEELIILLEDGFNNVESFKKEFYAYGRYISGHEKYSKYFKLTTLDGKDAFYAWIKRKACRDPITGNATDCYE